VHDVVNAIDELGPVGAVDLAAIGSSDLRGLVRSIVDRHHAYVRRITPVIDGWLEKLVRRHGDRHPELTTVRTTFTWLSEDLIAHMVKEEHILFPYIEALAGAADTGAAPRAEFGTIANPIGMMEREHQDAGKQLQRLRIATNGYVPPQDGCTTYRLCYEELARFESDLHRHVHLENNVLFPQALELERTLEAHRRTV
jgi:regulator of cell morphogenesis and NO signaling